jgi:uncharacterized membrane protein YczE
MTGLNTRTGIPIGRVRFAIEATLLVAGWLLGGSVGLGTVLVTVLIGEVVALFFGIVGRLSKPENGFSPSKSKI